MTAYAAHSSMREARAQYFWADHFGDDGGYDAKWVHFQLGPVPMKTPNTSGRKRAVAFHDLHHIWELLDQTVDQTRILAALISPALRTLRS